MSQVQNSRINMIGILFRNISMINLVFHRKSSELSMYSLIVKSWGSFDDPIANKVCDT